MSSKKRKRRNEILDLMQTQKSVSVDQLVTTFGVSAQTVRRDINHLCHENLLRRRHGGADLFEKQLNLPYQQRKTTNSQAKEAIAHTAATLIPDDATVFFSIGTTPAFVAEALRARKRLTVVTNNLNVVMALSNEPTNRIIVPGGEVRLPDLDILGDEVTRFFQGYRAEFGICGVAGVAEDGALLDFHASEVRVREQIRIACETSILVLDHTKFGRVAPVVGGNLSDADRIIMDRAPDARFAPVLERVADRLTLVEGGLQ